MIVRAWSDLLKQGYMSLLSIASLLPTSWRRASNIHLSVLLLFAWSTFMYRDVWPLATYTLTPRDIHEGWLIWLKIGILSLAAVVIPLVVPRRYIPVDPQVRLSSWKSVSESFTHVCDRRTQCLLQIQSKQPLSFHSYCTSSWTTSSSKLCKCLI